VGNGTVASFQLFGLTFSVANLVSGAIVFLLAIIFVIATTRHITMRPSKGQNVIEWLIDFTNGVLKGNLPANEVRGYGLWGFTLFIFIFLSNQLGLFFNLMINGKAIVRSPTSDPVVTLTMSLMTVVFANYSSIRRWGTKGYLTSFVKPFWFFFPINIFEELSSFLTLGLRIFGIIYSGEVLLEMIWQLAESHGILTMALSLPIEMIWQGFSAFLGAIQAYVFIMLSSVYIGRKLQEED